ncbi:MAG: peroxiredoxin family protein [Planctomycetota bacterium]
MSNSLPHAQKLYERFQRDGRVRVVAVATAFEKEQWPWMADEDKIRQALRQKGWEFPVMRDEEEQTVRILGLRGTYGTPMTLVVDPFGVVRWHNFNGTARTARQVEETVDELLESFYVPPIDGLLPKLKAYAQGRYGAAYKRASAVLEAEDPPEELREQARRVLSNLEAGVKRLVEESAVRRRRGHPGAALDRLQKAVMLFEGVPQAGAAARKLKELKADWAFKKERRAEQALDKVLARLAKPNASRKSAQKKLRRMLASYEDTPLARRIAAALRALE